MSQSAPGFYASYASHKRYETPNIGAKDMRRFDEIAWMPGACRAEHRFLEIGCGTGAFLAYLAAKGCKDFWGIDQDPALEAVMPATVRGHFQCRDALAVLDDAGLGVFDRIVAFDVLEHFTPEDALALLTRAQNKLAAQGRVIVKVPNAASPWGAQYQYGDLTHKTAFTSVSLKQLADAAGMDMLAALPVRQGSRRRLLTDALAHRFLSWALLTPPDIWTANLVAIFAKR